MASRRDEIRGIAMSLFAQSGYQASSMRDIADASGVLAGSLYSHFVSKAQIVEEIVGRFYDELIPAQRAVLESPGNGAGRLTAMLEAAFRTCANHRSELTILHYEWMTISALEELADVVDRSNETLDLWYAVLDQGIEDGSLQPWIDPEVLVRLLTSSIHGLLDTRRYVQRGAPVLDVNELVAMLQQTLLDGVVAREERLAI